MLLICKACTTAYSVGAPKCPHCGGRKYVEQGSKEHEAMLAAVPAADADIGQEVGVNAVNG